MRRIASVAGGLVLLASTLLLWGWVARESAADALVLTEVDGEVLVPGAVGEALPARRGAVLTRDQRLSTGRDGRAVLAIGPESRIRVGSGSSVRIRHVDEDGVHVELEGGALRATVRPASGALRVSSRGREVVATDADLAVGLSEGGGFQAEVTRGHAQVRGFEGVGALAAGQRVTVTGDRTQLGQIPDDLLLEVAWPAETRTRAAMAQVVGRTEPGARVRISGPAGEVVVDADADGGFGADVALREGDNDFSVEAVDPLGNRADAGGRLVRETRGPAFRGGVEHGP